MTVANGIIWKKTGLMMVFARNANDPDTIADFMNDLEREQND